MAGHDKPQRMALLKGLLLGLLLAGANLADAAEGWGSYLKPFSAQSPWNARPLGAVLDGFEIPRSTYQPSIAEGTYSTGVFRSSASDRPVRLMPLPGRKGIWDPDAEQMRPAIDIPRWPADVLPASGSDGHADVVDEIAGVIHSFFQLKLIDGQWHAGQYAWTRLDGRGWGEPGHYFQGARAAAVPSMGGIIRRHEINDGDTAYRHALAISLTYNALSAGPTYIFPATSADATAARTNTGRIPEGALLMLPADYDTTVIANPRLRKVAETLKLYGGYVVDRNVGTPFGIYVENGSKFSLHGKDWDNPTGRELDRMRAALRQVVKVSGWLDGNGQPMAMERRLNLLSMRGAWTLSRGARLGVYDTWQQAVVFEAGSGTVEQRNNSRSMMQPISWALPKAGESYRLAVRASGGARLRLQLLAADSSAVMFDSGELESGTSRVFQWPAGMLRHQVVAYSGTDGQASSVGASLVPMDAHEGSPEMRQ